MGRDRTRASDCRRRPLRCVAYFSHALLLASSLAASAADWRYAARFSEASETLEVEVCPPAGERVLLESLEAHAHDYLVPLDPNVWDTAVGRERLSAREAGCASYAVALGRLADRNGNDHGYRVGPDLLLWPASWLWWPPSRRVDMQLVMTLPNGWYFSAPWPQPDPRRAVYTLGSWPRYWPALTAFTRTPGQVIARGKDRLQLAVLGKLAPAERTRMHAWVSHLADLLDGMVGGLPLPQVQALVVPTARGGGPVPWGQVYRGGLGGVHFFVNLEETQASFIEDWTGAHEVSHLLHPYLGARGSWMGEGLASYLQNVLRARGGVLPPAEAWERLVAGFERGRKHPARDQPLSEVATGMHDSRAYMRVYWSGAAFWLAADVELRQRTQGRQNLDRALAAFADCCLPALRPWTPTEFARELDRLTGETVFAPAAARAESAMNFPDLDPLYRELGIELDARRQVKGFDDAAPDAGIRRAIMGRRSGNP